MANPAVCPDCGARQILDVSGPFSFPKCPQCDGAPSPKSERPDGGGRSKVRLFVALGLAVGLALAGVAAAGLFALSRSDARGTKPEVTETRKEVAEPVSPKPPPQPAPQPEELPSLPAPDDKALPGELVYKRLLQSTAFILIAERVGGRTYIAAGSGVLVHGSRRWF